MFYLLILSLIGGVLTLFSGFLMLYNPRLAKSLSDNATSFAAGVLLTTAFLGLMPEANHLSGELVFSWTLFAFLFMFLLDSFMTGFHHHSHKKAKGKQAKAVVPMVILGDTIHNFIDGVAIGASYVVSPALGLAASFSTLLHEIPHEVGDFGVMLAKGWKRKNIITINVISSLATVLGAFAVYFSDVGDSVIATLMSLSAGIFIYLAAVNFIPRIGKSGLVKSSIVFLLGFLIMYLMFSLLPHTH